MSNKIQVKIDVEKARELIQKRSYKNKEGKEVEVQEIVFEMIPIKEPKVIYDHEKFQLVKTHALAKIQTKEERDAKSPTEWINGDGVSQVWKSDNNSQGGFETVSSDNITKEDPSDLPF